MKALTKTDFHFNGQKSVYHGKVRDVYNINDDLMVMVATHYRHLSELETGYPRPHGHRGSEV